MKTKSFALFVFLCVLFMFETGYAGRRQKQIPQDNAMDVSDFSVYYDLNTNATIKKMMPRPWYQPGWMLRLPFQGGRCSCDTYKCKCCSGLRVPQKGFDRRTCAELTYEPEDALLALEVKMGNETLLTKTYGAFNPPPFCVPIPITMPIPFLDMCIRLFDITVSQGKMHVCMDWDTRIDQAPVVILHFECMNMGLDGISLSKPGSGGSTQSSDADKISTTESSQVNGDVYDAVTENEHGLTSSSIFNNSIKYI
ncbi:uncharacterized protein LOC142973044 [Anticarsia gemmatalis]|uniref:uncharacterized protein LOC142973044 n=1 Tax=Anticarsia gemmatalis TaxID=129554 RepID=UPI003F7627CE